MNKTYSAISLFSGAGGLDIGFKKAGVNVLWANEIDKDAVLTYQANHPDTPIQKGSITELYTELEEYKGTDILFGGPPCQGFSVAGKMDPFDIRSTLIWNYLDAVDIVRPKAFVMENVKALATNQKWKDVREKFITISRDMGYDCYSFILNSSHYGVPQKRERVFFVGFDKKELNYSKFLSRIENHKEYPLPVKDIISQLGPAGTTTNPLTCTAKITLAVNPVLRKSPYAGMLFNGAGRPLDLDGASNTLPASMGGNKTPIIDELLLYDEDADNWVVNYHQALIKGNISPEFRKAPDRLRRLTTKEAALIQTFPENYIFKGSKTSIYKQIGNAVPIKLAKAVASAVIDELRDTPVCIYNNKNEEQLSIDSLV